MQDLIDNVGKVVRGKREKIRLAIACLLTEGHLLLEDVPGTGKTTMARAIAESIAGSWKRVQFTPDLLPTDLTGVMIYEQTTGAFRFRKGPVFANILVADEINRGSPKTQSALLEVMEERQVTSDGVSRLVPRPFFVVATQNPRDSQGTFPLPDVQLDRFTMRISLGYADTATEIGILETFHRGHREIRVPAVTEIESLQHLIDEVDQLQVAPSVYEYIVTVADATRSHRDLRLGTSTRGTIALLRTSKAWAATAGRDFVTPDDVQDVAQPVLAHRIALTAEAQLRSASAEMIIESILDETPVPRTR